ncbi:Iron-sulfur clusters incorporation protein [Perkinsus olseni]|uniref:Iron-sulfur clusters incorporation protein n=1 Tax=Perkinsus olseni TaxID=32597 RepID=A0A7J6LCK2_PEROL|nr:Iron-sulfur clusters incorporation protein [Perkinsus olseni]
MLGWSRRAFAPALVRPVQQLIITRGCAPAMMRSSFIRHTTHPSVAFITTESTSSRTNGVDGTGSNLNRDQKVMEENERLSTAYTGSSPSSTEPSEAPSFSKEQTSDGDGSSGPTTPPPEKEQTSDGDGSSGPTTPPPEKEQTSGGDGSSGSTTPPPRTPTGSRGGRKSSSNATLWKILGVSVAGLAGLSGYYLSSSQNPSSATEQGASSTPSSVIKSLGQRALDAFENFNEVTREWFQIIGDKLVPMKKGPWLLDLETMHYPEYVPTLIVDLDKVVCHLEYDRKTGWQVVKRPGADKFFKELQHYYELVCYSDDVVPVASDVMMKWEVPCTGVLHRDFCRKTRKGYVKDISQLGRKADKIIQLDHEEVALGKNKDNGILIKPYDGDPDDRELYDLIDFLKAAAVSQEDLRDFIKKYGGGLDGNIGKRYLIEKKEKEEAVQHRRTIGRAFVSGSGGFPSSPPNFNSFGTSSRGTLRLLKSRSLIKVSGKGTFNFMQGLCTQDVCRVFGVGANGPEGEIQPTVAAAVFLSPKGRVLFDCLMYTGVAQKPDSFGEVENGNGKEESLLVDVDKTVVDTVMRLFIRHRVHLPLDIEKMDELGVYWTPPSPSFYQNGSGDDSGRATEVSGYEDPRVKELGVRAILPKENSNDADPQSTESSYRRLRVGLVVPEGPQEMTPDKILPLNYNLDITNHIAFNKGCYIGQELTTRASKKLAVRKRLFGIRLGGSNAVGENVEPGTEIFCDGESIGKIVVASAGDDEDDLLGIAQIHAPKGMQMNTKQAMVQSAKKYLENGKIYIKPDTTAREVELTIPKYALS